MIRSKSISFSDHRAMIIGATGEIGASIAKELASLGMNLVLHGGNNRDKMDSLLDDVQNRTGGKWKIESFLTRCDKPEDITPYVRERLPVDILIVVFGPFFQGVTGCEGLSNIRRLGELNFLFPVNLVSLCLPGMIERNFGRIILFGGTNTHFLKGFKTTAAYSAFKIALASYTKSIAMEYGRYNITCNMINPGFIETSQYTVEEKKRYKQFISQGRFGTPKELASLVLFLIGDRASYINGAIIPVDGGLKL